MIGHTSRLGFCRAVVGLVLLLTPSGAWAQVNGVLREVYTGIPGLYVEDLLNSPAYPSQPSSVEILPDFEAPVDVDDYYGQRLRAILVAPQTGEYRFWVASDDYSVLHLGTDDTPGSKQLIAQVAGWTNSREWEKYPAQQSAAIPLVAGQRYYLEALMKEQEGGDNLAVRWQLPDGTFEEPIPNARLEAYGLGPPVIAQQPKSISVQEGAEAAFSVQLEMDLGAAYQWQRDGVDIPGATGSEYVVESAQLADDQVQFRCAISNAYGSVVSEAATLGVLPDTTPPVLLSAFTLGHPNRVTVLFSEPVEAASALEPGNYGLAPDGYVAAVFFGGDEASVILETSTLAAGQTYLLSVSNVRDQAASPNTIAAGSQASFRLDFEPLGIGLVRGTPEPLGPSRRRGALTISEIMYHPGPRTDGLDTEFVEIYNSDEVSIDLSGYRLSGEVDYTFPPGTTISARGFLVVAPTPGDIEAAYGITGVVGGFTDRLANEGGELRLHNRLNAVLCELEFDDDPPWPAAADGGGHALVLTRPSYGEDDERAWAAGARGGGTPGTQEPWTASDYDTVMINEIFAHSNDPLVDYVELYNYCASPVTLDGCILTDDPAVDRYVFPAGTQIPAKGFLVLEETQLGFACSAAGETVFLKTPDGGRVIDAVRFGPQAPGISWGRTPDGAAEFRELDGLTPGAANPGAMVRPVVINELMYHPPSGDDADEFLELHHTGDTPADLGGWRLAGGIDFGFLAGTVVPPHGYLVVAKDRQRLLANHPGLDPAAVVGNYGGVLADGGERVRLEMPLQLVTLENSAPVTNTVYVTVDEVAYRDGGQWGQWSDRGGSSLELVDPRADNRLAANWADSDETAKAAWTTIAHTGVLDLGQGAINEVQAMLLRAGECLIDNVEVFAGGGANRVANGAFESGLAPWVIQGNHVHSDWSDPGEGDGGSRALHLRATAGGDNGANRVESDLTTSLSAGATATIRARARWLCGHPDLLLRLHGNHLEAVGTLPIPSNLGTPGAPNSRARANGAPAIHQVTHFPVLPAHNQPVTVAARLDDPDGLASLVVRYRLDPDPEYQVAAMTYRGAGWYAATLPARPAGTLLAFFIEAVDASPDRAVSTYPPHPAGRDCLIRFGDPTPPGNFGIYRMWMTQQNVQTWSAREKMSNEPLDGTFVYGNFRAVYNAGAHYRGSPWIRPGYNSPVGALCAYVWTFPADEPVLGTDEFNLDTLEPDRDNTYQRERTSFWIADQLGVSFSHQRYVRIVFNGNQRGTVYADSQQANGDYMDTWFPDDSRGEIFKIDDWFEFNDAVAMEFNVDARLENYTTTDGTKKQARYRWNWEKKSNRGLDDDYRRLFALVDAVNTPAAAGYVEAVEALVDVEQWMRVFAVRRVVADWDGYSFSRGKNTFTYKPERDRWKMVLWDLDFSLGGGSRSATQGLFEEVQDPTIWRMYNTPALGRVYLRALHDAAVGPLQSAAVGPVLTAWHQALVNNSVPAADPSAVDSWIATRRAFILSELSPYSGMALAITSNDGADFSTPENLVTLAGTAPIQVRTLLVNGAAVPMNWTSRTAWELEVVLAAGANLLSFTALGSNGEPLAGLADSITITCTGSLEDPAEALVINEIMYHPAAPAAEFVEIHNRSRTTAFDLTGYRLAGADFDFPAGTRILPGAFLVVAEDLAGHLAAYGSVDAVVGVMNGSLSNGGETLRLVRLGATPAEDLVIDEVTYEDDPPWPARADGGGSSLQLIDPAQDNDRVANWAAVEGTGSSTQTNLLVDYPAVWKYHDLGQDMGTAWRAPTYPDGDWAEGPGLLAVEDSPMPEPIRTVLTLGATTFYFRHAFTFTGNPGAAQLSVETILDDGAVYYLNGTEVLRLGMDPGTPGYGTFADRSVSEATREGPFPIPAGPLLAGENVLAVEVHQTNAGSSDVVLGVRLAAVGSSGLAYTPGAANQVSGGLPPVPALWLNEVQPGNVNGPRDAAGDADPWIELFNSGDAPVDLSAFFLSLDYGAATRWSFPSGAGLGAGEFLVVWVDGESAETTGTEYHASLVLPRDPGAISLLQDEDPDPALLIDYLNYGSVPDDRSFGAWPDGTPSRRQLFYYATPGAPNSPLYPALSVFINEWMSANSATVYDPADGDADDWFELVNLGPVAVDLSGFYLTDNLADPFQWAIPDGTLIPSGGFLLVWADEEPGQNQPGQSDLHANFKLGRQGEDIGLFTPSGELVDAVTFGPQADDQSTGRWPDGSATIIDLNRPTPGTANHRLRITSATLAGPNTLRLEWALDSTGPNYIEVSDGLDDPSWILYPGNPGSSSIPPVDLPLDQAPHRVYRLLVLPQ